LSINRRTGRVRSGNAAGHNNAMPQINPMVGVDLWQNRDLIKWYLIQAGEIGGGLEDTGYKQLFTKNGALPLRLTGRHTYCHQVPVTMPNGDEYEVFAVSTSCNQGSQIFNQTVAFNMQTKVYEVWDSIPVPSDQIQHSSMVYYDDDTGMLYFFDQGARVWRMDVWNKRKWDTTPYATGVGRPYTNLMRCDKYKKGNYLVINGAYTNWQSIGKDTGTGTERWMPQAISIFNLGTKAYKEIAVTGPGAIYVGTALHGTDPGDSAITDKGIEYGGWVEDGQVVDNYNDRAILIRCGLHGGQSSTYVGLDLSKLGADGMSASSIESTVLRSKMKYFAGGVQNRTTPIDFKAFPIITDDAEDIGIWSLVDQAA
jgi:hypothetical protein